MASIRRSYAGFTEEEKEVLRHINKIKDKMSKEYIKELTEKGFLHRKETETSVKVKRSKPKPGSDSSKSLSE